MEKLSPHLEIPTSLPALVDQHVNPLLRRGELDLLEAGGSGRYLRAIGRHNNYFITLPSHPGATIREGEPGLLCHTKNTKTDMLLLPFQIISRIKVGSARKGAVPTATWSVWKMSKSPFTEKMCQELRFLALQLAKLEEDDELLDLTQNMKADDFANALFDRVLIGADCQRYLSANDSKARVGVLAAAIRKELSKDTLSELRAEVEKADLPLAIKSQVELYLQNQSGTLGQSGSTHHFVKTVLATPFNSQKALLPFDKEEGERELNLSHGFAQELKRNLLDFNLDLRLQSKNGARGWVKPLLLVGPPGIGKTSILQTAARMLQRQLALIPLGGISRVETLTGFPLTYVDSREGLILRRLIEAKTTNTLLAFDEIDKVASESCLSFIMELLDPVQNKSFRDSYIDYPLDLSQTLMIGTANSIKKLPAALVDRFKVVELRGYSPQEKMSIAQNYLIPHILAKFHLEQKMVTFEKEAVEHVIYAYTSEAGLRQLSEKLETVVIRNYEKGQLIVNKEMVATTLGVGFNLDSLESKANIIGACPMLYVSGNGTGLVGTTQSVLLSEQGREILTGNVDVMHKETLLVARNYLVAHGDELGLSSTLIEGLLRKRIHNHSDDISIPKEGSSCGVAMFLSLVSLLRQQVVPENLVVTGEITLDGRVLEVGGIREKLIAAHRAQKKFAIIPQANLQDLRDLPEDVKREVRVVGVKHLLEVVNLAFAPRQDDINSL